VPSLNICAAMAPTPSLSGVSKLVEPPMKSMFSATSGRSCFSTTISSAPLASFVFDQVGMRIVGDFPTFGATLRSSVDCAASEGSGSASTSAARTAARALDGARRAIIVCPP
jgi:hypothetical protein